MINEYNESGAAVVFFVQSNQTRANILLNPQPCRGFIANDTGEWIFFDKNSNPYILSVHAKILVTATEPPTPSAGECTPWFDTTEGDPPQSLKLKFSDGTNKGIRIPVDYV